MLHESSSRATTDPWHIHCLVVLFHVWLLIYNVKRPSTCLHGLYCIAHTRTKLLSSTPHTGGKLWRFEVVFQVPIRHKLKEEHHWESGCDTANHLQDMWIAAIWHFLHHVYFITEHFAFFYAIVPCNGKKRTAIQRENLVGSQFGTFPQTIHLIGLKLSRSQM